MCTSMRTEPFRVDYNYQFHNTHGADPIDIVDIGMPTNNYDLEQRHRHHRWPACTRIAKSEYVKPGIEIHLGS